MNLKEKYQELQKKHRQLQKEFDQYKLESIKWDVDDMLYIAETRGTKISRRNARKLLQHMIYKHDAEQGICWLTIDCWLDMWSSKMITI